MNVKFKVRIYALFQFISFVALLLAVIGIGVSLINASVKTSSDSAQWWRDETINVLTFNQAEISSILGSVLVYVALALLVLTWILGWLMFVVKDRNFYDQVFLLFICIPVISNLFALFAQLSLNTHKFTSAKLQKEEIEIEKTKIIALFNAKKRELKKAEKDEFVRVQAELDKTPDIKMVATTSKVSNGKTQDIALKRTKVVVEPKVKTSNKEIVKKSTPKKVAKPTAKKPVAKKTTTKKVNKKPANKPTAKKPVAKKTVKKK